jgi:hypothetical protein
MWEAELQEIVKTLPVASAGSGWKEILGACDREIFPTSRWGVL